MERGRRDRTEEVDLTRRKDAISPPGLGGQSDDPGTTRKNRFYLPTLDGYRALAILLVLMVHGTDRIFAPRGTHPNGKMWFICLSGNHGVDLFFVLSGFLITTRLIEEFRRTGRMDLRAFYLRRAFRILPASITFLCVAGALGLLGIIHFTNLRLELFSCLTFWRNYLIFPVQTGWYTGHFWSLSTEEHFYLVWPAVVILLAPEGALPLAIGSVLAGMYCGVILHEGTSHLPWPFLVEMRSISYLASGCAAALVLGRPAMRAWVTEHLTPVAWGAIFVLALVAVRVPRMGCALPACLALLIVGTVLHPGWRVSRMLENRTLRWIGSISYSLYLWQQLFLLRIDVPADLAIQNSLWRFIPPFLCAAASYYLVEKPMLRVGHSFVKRWDVTENATDARQAA